MTKRTSSPSGREVRSLSESRKPREARLRGKRSNAAVPVVELNGYSLTQAAALVNRSPSAIRRWIRMGMVDCGTKVEIGNATVYLFTDEDIRHMRAAMVNIKPGPRTK